MHAAGIGMRSSIVVEKSLYIRALAQLRMCWTSLTLVA
jgi:hypothetical protein